MGLVTLQVSDVLDDKFLDLWLEHAANFVVNCSTGELKIQSNSSTPLRCFCHDVLVYMVGMWMAMCCVVLLILPWSAFCGSIDAL